MKEEKCYIVLYGDSYFEFGEGFFIAEIKDDDRIYELDSDVDITEFPNWHDVDGYEDYFFPNIAEANKLANKLKERKK